MLKMQGFWLRKKGICATMKLVTKKCVMSKTMRQTSVRVLALLFAAIEGMGAGSMNNTQSKTLLTEGSIWKKMVAFALPLFFGNLFQQLCTHGRLSDRRESPGEQCPGGGELVRQPDFSACWIF